MTAIFIKLLNMSISASWIVLAVLILRLLLKKAPKWIMVALWGVVALRLVLPFSIESAFSLIPSTEAVDPVQEGLKEKIKVQCSCCEKLMLISFRSFFLYGEPYFSSVLSLSGILCFLGFFFISLN